MCFIPQLKTIVASSMAFIIFSFLWTIHHVFLVLWCLEYGLGIQSEFSFIDLRPSLFVLVPGKNNTKIPFVRQYVQKIILKFITTHCTMAWMYTFSLPVMRGGGVACSHHHTRTSKYRGRVIVEAPAKIWDDLEHPKSLQTSLETISMEYRIVSILEGDVSIPSGLRLKQVSVNIVLFFREDSTFTCDVIWCV